MDHLSLVTLRSLYSGWLCHAEVSPKEDQTFCMGKNY